MVNEEVDRLVSNFEEQMKRQGVSLELYYQVTNTKEEDLRAQMEKEAFNNVLYRLMLDEIIKLEKIDVTKEEVDQEIKDLSERYKITEEEVLKEIGSFDLVKYDLKIKRAIELLKEYNK